MLLLPRRQTGGRRRTRKLCLQGTELLIGAEALGRFHQRAHVFRLGVFSQRAAGTDDQALAAGGLHNILHLREYGLGRPDAHGIAGVDIAHQDNVVGDDGTGMPHIHLPVHFQDLGAQTAHILDDAVGIAADVDGIGAGQIPTGLPENWEKAA